MVPEVRHLLWTLAWVEPSSADHVLAWPRRRQQHQALLNTVTINAVLLINWNCGCSIQLSSLPALIRRGSALKRPWHLQRQERIENILLTLNPLRCFVGSELLELYGLDTSSAHGAGNAAG